MVLEKKELKEYVSGKNVLIVSTERTFCEYTYEILLEVGRYAMKKEMMEFNSNSAKMRNIWVKVGLLCKNMKNVEVIVICSNQEEKYLARHRKFVGKTVVRIRQKMQ